MNFHRPTILAIAIAIALVLVLAVLPSADLFAEENPLPEIAEYHFSAMLSTGEGVSASELPKWAGPLQNEGGEFNSETGSWRAASPLPDGDGKLIIDLDRSLLPQQLALCLTYESTSDGDFSVQLLDAAGKTVAIDLFQNVVALGRESQTDTFIIPLQKYPAAEKLAIRRVNGTVIIHGFVLFPVVGEILTEVQSHAELAALFGDPLNENSSLADSLANYVPKDAAEASRIEKTLASIPGAPVVDFGRFKQAANGVMLTSGAGEDYCGHQLEFFNIDADGWLSSDKPAWISLYRTEGKSFRISGEVILAEGSGPWAGTDSPDGFAIFLREFDSLHRYNANSRGMRVKRRLVEGEEIAQFARPFEFTPPQRGKSYRFSVEAGPDLISFSLGGQIGMIRGPFNLDGANKIVVTPGAKIRNLRLKMLR